MRSDRARTPLWQRLYLDLARARRQRPHLLADGPHRVLRRRQPGLQPDAVAVGLHVLRAGAALARRDAAARPPPRARASRGSRGAAAGRRPMAHAAFLLASAGRRGAAINRGLVARRAAARLRRRPRHLHRHLRPAGAGRRAADARRRHRRGGAARRDRPSSGLDATIARRPGRQRRRAPSTTPTPTSAPTSRTPTGSTRRRSRGRRSCATRTSSAARAAADARAARARRRTAILVSKETITDYSLTRGDLLRLRVLDRTSGRFRVVPFHVVGAVQEFPSAPKDSFMVANLRLPEAAAHDGGPNVVFARTSGDPAARRAARGGARRRPTGRPSGTSPSRPQQTVSSITTVDLTGIAASRASSPSLLAAAAMALVRRPRRSPSDGRSSRRWPRSAPRSAQIAAFLWCEAALVLAAALALAAGLGWLLAEMLVAMLQHVFDPPPDRSRFPGRSSERSRPRRSPPRSSPPDLPSEGSVDYLSARYCGSSEGNGALRTSRARIRTAGE